MRPTLLLLALALAGCAATDRLVYQPTRAPEGYPPTPTQIEDAQFASADGTRLHGWFVQAEQPRAVVLFLHGNASNVAGWRRYLGLYAERMRCSVLVFDYRGYGRSEGEPTEEGVVADARAARSWLAKRTGTDEKRIVLAGCSLGGGVAVQLARDGARGLVLENTFTSVPDVAASKVPLLPVAWLMRTKLDSLAAIREYRGPLLQTHGDADAVIPVEQGKRLFAAANEPKEFVLVPGGGHMSPPTREWLAALDRFLEGLP